MLSSTTTTTFKKSSSLLDRKIEETAAGLQPSYSNRLRSTNENNAATIVEYIAAMKSEINLSDSYRKGIIEVFTRLSKDRDDRPFKDLTRTDIITFLDSLRKTETQDPMHKWIGTYN